MTNGKTTKIRHNFRKKPSEIGAVKRYLIHPKENQVQNNCDICKNQFENKLFPKNRGFPISLF